MKTAKNEENLWMINQARSVAHNAYAPYSNFHVGACVLYDNGNYFLGCNVENSSYGLSLCAERNALSTAITSGEKGKLKAIAIVGLETRHCLPCGACRQWLYEFSIISKQNINIIVENENPDTDNPVIYSIYDLLPNAFTL